MRVVVDSYVYTLIKISSLKHLSMKVEDYAVLSRIKDPRDLLNALEKFFPSISLKVTELNLINIEKALFSIYFKIYEKILASSPYQMQIFLRTLLQRYEIWNVKAFLLGKLANFTDKQIKDEILYEAQSLLQRERFIEELLSSKTFEDGIDYLLSTKYKRVLEQGYNYYKQSGEIFYPEALLDKFFYTQLLDSSTYFTGEEGDIFINYMRKLIDQYNITLVFRSVKTKVPAELIEKLIIPHNGNFSLQFLIDLARSGDLNYILNKLQDFAREKAMFKAIVDDLTLNDPISPFISRLRKNLIFGIGGTMSVDLDATTIDQILKLIVYKETEIFRVLKLFVKIFHKIED